ncbi:MAG: hypothetical protein J07HN6_01162 [Halonotius sp. J07HN6]|nr:MAG: hypothetical protein J07HN6_01162 [Halonotius sp. J07HN6]ERH05048.1 MAG: hypothetical protein J07HN4v3_00640 [Halonotius sp. J07HN4]
MSSAQSTDDEVFDEFLSANGHQTEPAGWDKSYNKKQCPDCGALHDSAATSCSVCGWLPDQ